MIIHARDLPAPRVLRASVCVIGGGPVGITLALELARVGRDVLMLEAGEGKPAAGGDDAYRGTVVDPALHGPLELCRVRALGGSSTAWAGRATPFDPIDFEARPWMADSGWPISYAAMLPFYCRAARYCEIGEFAFTVSEAFDRPLAPMIAHFDGSTSWSTDCLERFSCPTDFGQRYLKQLKQAPNLRVVLGATVVEVLLDGGGRRARGVDARTPEGEQIEVRASQVVVATGGLETARLLLASQRTQHAGLGNARDVVGRYYMSHLAGTLGRFVPNGGMQAVWNGYDQTDDGTYTRRRLSLRPQAQRKHQIGNVIARLHHPRISDPAHGSGVLSALRLMRRAIPHQFRHRLAEANDPRSSPLHRINILRDAPAVTRFALKMLVSRRLAARKYPSVVVRVPAGVFSLDVHAEQEPRRDSRVRLTHARDRFGMQRLEVDWRYSPTDIATVATAMKLLSEEICAADAGTLEISPGEVERELTRWGSYTGHHLGLARMGTDPRTSVVDANAMVHDVDGVYVAGAAVFPTSSQANPTLTAVALAIRLADHLATKGCHDA